MKTLYIAAAATFLALVISGCDQLGLGKKEMSAQYLMDNPEELKSETQRCAKLNFMEQSADQQCGMAREAARLIKQGK